MSGPGSIRVRDCIISFEPESGKSVEIALDDIVKVVLYKHDEITTDLLCCDLWLTSDVYWTFHEETPGWKDMLDLISTLPGFNRNWWQDVIQPAFAENRTVVFSR